MSRMPPSVLASLSFSRRRTSSSFFVRFEPATSSKSICSSSLRRWRRLCTVLKLVSMPPSQRWLTYGMPTRAAWSATGSCACFLVPTNRMVPPCATVWLDEVVGVVDVRQRLLQVDDVDAVALGEDEALHLGVPAAGLVSEVDTALEQLAHGHDGHGTSFRRAPRGARVKADPSAGPASRLSAPTSWPAPLAPCRRPLRYLPRGQMLGPLRRSTPSWCSSALGRRSGDRVDDARSRPVRTGRTRSLADRRPCSAPRGRIRRRAPGRTRIVHAEAPRRSCAGPARVGEPTTARAAGSVVHRAARPPATTLRRRPRITA